VTDWNSPGPVDDQPVPDDDPLSGVEWAGEPAYVPTPASEQVQPEPAADDYAPTRGRRGSAGNGQGNHSMGMRISRGAFWGFLALALVIGLAIGGGVLVWQRTALLSDIRALETRLSAAEASVTASADQLTALQTQLASSEASVADLMAQNTKLTSDLASVTAALAAAKASTGGAITVTELTVSPTSVDTSKTVALQVKVQGKADKVQVRIAGTGSVSSYSKTYNLTKSTTVGDIVTWKRSVTGPGKKGTYRCYATGYVGSKKTELAAYVTLTVK